MNLYEKLSWRRFLKCCLIVVTGAVIALPVGAAQLVDYSSIPPFITAGITPNVLVMLDNSGSMKTPVYNGGSFRCSGTGTDFDPTDDYYGMFDESKYYQYDTSIGVDLAGYDGSSGNAYTIDADGDGDTDSDDVDASGAFVEASCTPSVGVNCWSGNFLNWMVTRRIDAARKVMIGGKVESRAGYDYISGDSGDLEWKIVANNERSDGTICKSYSNSDNYTSYPDNTIYTVYSPVEAGAVQTTYDPYAKLKATIPTVITDNSGNIIGESGIIENFGQDAYAANWYTVELVNSYTDPVIIATPMAYGGSDPANIRIYDEDSSDNMFKVRAEEWEYKDDDAHANEDVSYLVIEKGEYTLGGGHKIVADNVEVGTSFSWVPYAEAFTSVPVVVSNVVTNRSADTVTTRQRNVGTIQFEIKIQDEEDPTDGDDNPHPSEKVAYIGLDTGSYTDGGSINFLVGTKNSVTSSWSTISYSDTTYEPNFLAAMQTTNDNDTAALRYQNLSTTSVEIIAQEEKSLDNETTHLAEDVGYIIISGLSEVEYNLAVVVEDEPTGLLHDVVDDVRLGVSFYKYDKASSDIYNSETIHGGTLRLNIPLNPFIKNPPDDDFRVVDTPVKSSIDYVVDAIEHYPLVWGTTPLAENYFEVIRYFQQVAPYYDGSVNSGSTAINYVTNDAWDPFYFEDPDGNGDTSDAGTLSCPQCNILLFTDGEPYKDGYVPDNLADYDFLDFDDDSNSNDCFATGANDRSCENNLNDLAKWAYCDTAGNSGNCVGDKRDLRSDLESEQNLTTYTVSFGSDVVKTILQQTADHGGGIAYHADDGSQLAGQLTAVFDQITDRASGTSASVISNSRTGDGAIYQSVFFPKKETDSYTVNWVGQVHALFVDEYGNMREDDGDAILEVSDDRIVVFNDDGTVNLYNDGDGNQQLELDVSTCPLDTTTSTCLDTLDASVDIDDLDYLWNSSDWLNSMSDSAAQSQRSTYISNADARHIITWVDNDRDGLVDTGEVIDFASPSTPSSDDIVDDDEIYPWLNLYPSFVDTPVAISSLSSSVLTSYLQVQSKRQINYIRGSDCVDSTDPENCNTSSLTISSVAIPDSEMRSRQYDSDSGTGTSLKTWRLGDIVYSTPTLVSSSAENFHLLYRDLSYAPFARKYSNRRQVVYAGANDGMVHAFNSGFYDSTNKRYCRSDDFSTDLACNDSTQPVLGAELWAYVPFNLLPHLYWLTQPDYDENVHVYYVDQKPRVFDAKIFAEESECSDVYDAACIHPNGWGTVMVIGMNLGGGSIIADLDKTDGAAPVADDPTMKSAFMVFDITNPEAEPVLLAELVMPDMGFSTSYPTVAVLKDGDHDGAYEDSSSGENKWYLVFGSGPADANGDPGGAISATGDYDNTALGDYKSLQSAKIYMVDLVELAKNNTLKSFNGDTLTDGLHTYASLDSNSFVSTPVAVDFDLDYNVDSIYFGTISGSASNWGGKMRRIVFDDDNTASNWDAESVLFDAGQPISAAPAIAEDDDGRNWVFWGTGRYYTVDDKSDTNQQSYYGIKEPLNDSNERNWGTVTSSTLVDVTDFIVYTDETIDASSVDIDADGDSTAKTFDDLLVDQDGHDGWFLNFDTLVTDPDTGSVSKAERNLGQAVLLGGLLSFTTFTPDADVCEQGGTSNLWALYYKSGTSYPSGILGTETSSDKEIALKTLSLGQGLATSPAAHVGRNSSSSLFVQSSTGQIIKIEQENPMSIKSGLRSWQIQE